MKKLSIILGLLLFAGYSQAQSQAELQKKMQEAQKQLQQLKSNPQYQQAMQKAKEAMQQMKSDTNLQKQMSASQAQLEAMKKDHPEIGDVEIPDLNNMKMPKMPDLNAMSQQLKTSSQRLQNYSSAIDQTTPILNRFHHAEKLTQLSQKDILSMAQQCLSIAEKNLTPTLIDNIEKTIKDTSTNIATTGAFILASGGDKNAAIYLICSAILINPDDEWAINDLGVYLRDMNKLEQSLQCYFYANSLNKEKNTTINANIGWASAYYGDFETAIKYFDKALAINPDFQSANEGKAMIAYAKGDIAALFQCLAKEIKYVGGTGGPSTSFTMVASRSATEKLIEEGNKLEKDPTQDHTFDNNLPNEAPNTPPGADVDDVTLTQFKKVFVSKPEEIDRAIVFGTKQYQKTFKEWSQEIDRLNAQLRTLKPLGQKPYVDDEGYIIYPSNFEKYVIPLAPIEESLSNRLAWWRKKFNDKLEPFAVDARQHQKDLMNEYFEELKGCPFPDEGNKCYRKVMCKWTPIIYKSETNNLEGFSRIWDEYYRHEFNAVNWYLKATAPFISRVHQVGWNDYLNAERKHIVKGVYLELYVNWITGLNATSVFYRSGLPEDYATCNAGHNSIPKDAPDPFSKKPEHIKEFEGNCYNMSFDIQVGTIYSNCHEDKVEFGNDYLNLCYSHTTDAIAAKNQGYANDVNFTASAEKEFKIANISGNDVGVTGGLKGNVDMKFDKDWNFTGGKSSVSATADIGHVHLGGVEASRTATAEVVSGMRTINVGKLSVNASGPSIK